MFRRFIVYYYLRLDFASASGEDITGVVGVGFKADFNGLSDTVITSTGAGVST